MKKELSFEEAYTALEETVRKMEDKSVSLKDSMTLYEEACRLIVICREKLEEAKAGIVTIDEKIASLSKKDDLPVED